MATLAFGLRRKAVAAARGASAYVPKTPVEKAHGLPFWRNPEFSADKVALMYRVQALPGMPTVEYTGTTLERLGSQPQSGKMEQRGRKIFAADIQTATRYAKRAAYNTGETPVVVTVVSEGKKEMNDFMNKPLGAYSSWTPEEQAKHPVYIADMTEVPAPKDFTECM